MTVGTHKTSIRTDDEHTIIRYHDTDVVKFNSDYIILNSGGWETVTTKRRMNQTSEQYGLGFHVFQKDYIWYVSTGNQTISFVDGMTIEQETTYKIIRFYHPDMNREKRTVKHGLSLQQAQEHCNDPETRRDNVYFDGFETE